MDQSLSDLLRLHRDGAYVLKTPHVGNIYPNNLAIAALSIPMLLVDQTIGAKDKNFHPHRVIVGGVAETVADEELMTSLSRIRRVSERVPGRFMPGERLVDAHVTALRDAFPRSPIETSSQRAKRLADLMIPFLEVMTSIAPELWQRVVYPDGIVQQRPSPKSWFEVDDTGIHGLSTDGSGWIIPNAWNILGDGIIGAITSGRDTVYSLSGPDMIHYSRKIAGGMSAWYDAARPKLGGKLPATLTMVMVPVAELRLVTIRRRETSLNTLVDAYRALLDSKRIAGVRLKGISGEGRQAFIDAIQSERGRQLDAFRGALCDCREILYRIEDANSLTQYDLLAGEDLYVHPWGVETPVRAVVEMMSLLRRIMPEV